LRTPDVRGRAGYRGIREMNTTDGPPPQDIKPPGRLDFAAARTPVRPTATGHPPIFA